MSTRHGAIPHGKTGVEKYTRTKEQERSVIQRPKAGRILITPETRHANSNQVDQKSQRNALGNQEV